MTSDNRNSDTVVMIQIECCNTAVCWFQSQSVKTDTLKFPPFSLWDLIWLCESWRMMHIWDALQRCSARHPLWSVQCKFRGQQAAVTLHVYSPMCRPPSPSHCPHTYRRQPGESFVFGTKVNLAGKNLQHIIQESCMSLNNSYHLYSAWEWLILVGRMRKEQGWQS